MKTFHFGTICNITQEPQEITCACGFIATYNVLKYHQVLSKVISINEKSSFDQLATAPSLATVMVLPTFVQLWNNF